MRCRGPRVEKAPKKFMRLEGGILGKTVRIHRDNRCGRVSVVALLVALMVAGSARTACALVYKVVNLSPPASYTESFALGIGGGQPVGAAVASSGTVPHALLWNGTGTSYSYVDVNAGFSESQAYDTNGSQQAGYGKAGGSAHALLWSGSAADALDLHPTGFTASEAHGIDGAWQIGYGTTGGAIHSLLWNGTAASAVDLHPPSGSGFTNSWGFSVSGMQQVGYGSTASGTHALLWKGSAASYADLHPSGFANSFAVSNGGSQQVGHAFTGEPSTSPSHAFLWSGTAASAVDLTPVGFPNAAAKGTNGTFQVGFGQMSGAYFALLWRGSADGYTDLSQFLPSGLTDARAWAIDAQGNVVGYATNSLGTKSAVLWQSIPALWTGGGSSDWGTLTNWKADTVNAAVPDGMGERITLGQFPYNGTLDLGSAGRTVGQIALGDGVSTLIRSNGVKTLTLDNGTVPAPITVAGRHSITAALALASGMAVNTTSDTASLTISSAITGPGALTKNGPGTLTLGGAGNYSGGTTVTGGTLVIASLSALPTGRSLSIGAGGTLVLQSGLHATGAGGLAGSRVAGATASASSVPEPGTLALIASAAVLWLIWRRRKPHTS